MWTGPVSAASPQCKVSQSCGSVRACHRGSAGAVSESAAPHELGSSERDDTPAGLAPTFAKRARRLLEGSPPSRVGKITASCPQRRASRSPFEAGAGFLLCGRAPLASLRLWAHAWMRGELDCRLGGNDAGGEGIARASRPSLPRSPQTCRLAPARQGRALRGGADALGSRGFHCEGVARANTHLHLPHQET
jgi:hypothetical protein